MRGTERAQGLTMSGTERACPRTVRRHLTRLARARRLVLLAPPYAVPVPHVVKAFASSVQTWSNPMLAQYRSWPDRHVLVAWYCHRPTECYGRPGTDIPYRVRY
eukprot:3940756-Rhodomonas_salina.2